MVEIPVLYRDQHLLVVAKPAGLATTSPEAGESLARRVEQLDPEAPRLHPSSRLDAEVTGVVAFARTRKATKALLAARKRGVYERLYLGLAATMPESTQGLWGGVIAQHPTDPRKRVLLPAGSPGRPAVTRYQATAASGYVVLLQLRPGTGRTHQLRVHAAAAGAPLLGDRHYGGTTRLVLPDGRVVRMRRAMLHCLRVRVPDPDGADTRTFIAPVPEDMKAAWLRLGGDPALLARLHE